jgi:hypothetical protein
MLHELTWGKDACPPSFPLWQRRPPDGCVESFAEDDPNEPLVGVSATAVWTSVVKQVSTTRMDEGGKKTFANVSGRYFKVSSPFIVASHVCERV